MSVLRMKKSGAEVVQEVVSNLEVLLEKTGETSGMGLSSMKERSEHSGGSFSLFSSKGKGTTIQAFWPV